MSSTVETIIEKYFDKYDWQARVWPAIITFLPVLLGILAWFPDAELKVKAVAGGVVYVSVVALGAKIARSAGKRVQEKMLQKDGCLPSIRLMRWSDHTLGVETKKRYRTILSKHMQGTVFPTSEQEAADPISADDIYKSCSQWLNGKTRNHTTYWHIFAENIDYGYRRNMLGLKPSGIVISLLAISGCVSSLWFEVHHKLPISSLTVVGLVVCSILLFVWIFAVSEQWVRDGGDAYARALLEAIESLGKASQMPKVEKKSKDANKL